VTSESYFAVQCEYCKSLIPLAKRDENSIYRFADCFNARHNDQVPDAECFASGTYGFADLRKIDFDASTAFFPNLSFAQSIMVRP
jgi:hypothetical protein